MLPTEIVLIQLFREYDLVVERAYYNTSGQKMRVLCPFVADRMLTFCLKGCHNSIGVKKGFMGFKSFLWLLVGQKIIAENKSILL